MRSFEPAGVVTLLLSGPHGSCATMAATPVPMAWTMALGVRSMAYAAWRRAADGLEIQMGMAVYESRWVRNWTTARRALGAVSVRSTSAQPRAVARYSLRAAASGLSKTSGRS